MTSTTTTKTFALYSKTTGHGFGEWEATSADDAMDQMEEQAGETLDRSDIECRVVGRVVVETMPRALRASHEAAGNRGVYPANGAIRVTMDEGDAYEDEWTRIIGPADADSCEELPHVADVTCWTP